ncbi:hypothetical protein SALBM135S_01705 [Streptomyces alboniger]
MNSVSFTALSAELRRTYGIEVYPTLFYRRGTLTALAEHLWQEHPGELAGRFASAAGTVAAAAEARATRAEAPAERPRGGDVAVIGMAGLLPGSADLKEFWDYLTAGDDLVTEVPEGRWGPREAGARKRWGGFLPDVDRFDAAFFGISPREAELMDPQQRLLLEAVWSAVEDAGYRPSDLSGKRVGVFIGVAGADYLQAQRDAGVAPQAHTATGGALSVIPNRVSYLLDLRGPSMAVDTACSGSLTAVHQAVAALRDGSCDLAVAGGVNPNVPLAARVRRARPGRDAQPRRPLQDLRQPGRRICARRGRRRGAAQAAEPCGRRRRRRPRGDQGGRGQPRRPHHLAHRAQPGRPGRPGLAARAPRARWTPPCCFWTRAPRGTRCSPP